MTKEELIFKIADHEEDSRQSLITNHQGFTCLVEFVQVPEEVRKET